MYKENAGSMIVQEKLQQFFTATGNQYIPHRWLWMQIALMSLEFRKILKF